MAKVHSNSLFAGLSGRIGDLIFSTGKNGTIVRSAPVRDAGRKKKPSAMQQETRARFALANQFMAGAGQVIKLGCGNSNGSPHALAIKNLMRDAIEGYAPDLYINYSKVLVSQGTLSRPGSPVLQVLEGRRLELSWSNRIRKKATEMVMALFSPISNSWKTEICGLNQRKSMFFSVPEEMGELLEAYVFMRYNDGSKVSDSIYLGSLVLQ